MDRQGVEPGRTTWNHCWSQSPVKGNVRETESVADVLHNAVPVFFFLQCDCDIFHIVRDLGFGMMGFKNFRLVVEAVFGIFGLWEDRLWVYLVGMLVMRFWV